METTLNVHLDILDKLQHAADKRGISCSAMIVVLLQKVMRARDKNVCMGRLVQYQKRRRKEDWHRFHIVWRADDYEYFLDLRKLLKLSVSRILAEAVEKYLKKLRKKDFTDKNRIRNYVLMGRIVDKVRHWQFFWGLPQNIVQYLKQ